MLETKKEQREIGENVISAIFAELAIKLLFE